MEQKTNFNKGGSKMEYKNFFEVCKQGIFFRTNKGILNLYDLFKLPMEELLNIYKDLKQKVIIDDDPILAETGNKHKKDTLRFEVIKDIIIYRKQEAKRNELLKKKQQLENMLSEIKMKKLQEDPEAIVKEIEEVNKQLNQ